MPYKSHQRAAARNFDYLYDSDYIVPSDKDIEKAKQLAQKKCSIMKVPRKFDNMFEDAPKPQRPMFPSRLKNLSFTHKRASDTESLSSSCDNYSLSDERLAGGANNPNERKVYNVVTSPSECKSKPLGIDHFKPCPNVNIIDVKLSDSKMKTNVPLHVYCQEPPRRKDRRIKTRGTQTLYRESSAQTLPYLPDVSNKENELDDMEVFKLPTFLSGEGPPGIYEVEVLERTRKRWAFAKALKEHFKQQLEDAKEQARLSKHKHILAAFEWEYWIEREEHIQECQMMRLELLIRMFDKREREMHNASKMRIEQSCERIEAQRDAALHKNAVEFGRQMRRLEIRHRKLPRNWRKENIVSQLGSPNSEFYAPQQRFGTNPSRRHFKGGRKAFEARIDDLEKRVSTTGKLVCPFAKLKEWSTPKQRLREVEQNFCSEENLKKMYDSLTGLRKQSIKQKLVPKCLIEKQAPSMFSEHAPRKHSTLRGTHAFSAPKEEEQPSGLDQLSKEKEMGFQAKAEEKKLRSIYLKEQRKMEEIESMLADYEGTTIGWLMRFLSEEMSRMQEQRILHFITMLAQKERWRREAAEAGLRQKENEMRQIYEQLYMETHAAHTDVCKEYLGTILNVDIPDYAEYKATSNITTLAKTIDKDIQRWLNSLSNVQNPLNFDTLRYTLKDIIFPDVDEILRKREMEALSQYIIDDVLFGNIYQLLEPYDIATSIVNETVDRLIDNDLYYFSSECSSNCFCTLCQCTEQKREARGILRKIIRYAIPGRRWKTEPERIVIDILGDTLEDVFTSLLQRGSVCTSCSEYNFCELTHQISHTNIFEPTTLEISPLTSTYEEEIEISTLDHFFFDDEPDTNKDISDFATEPHLEHFKPELHFENTEDDKETKEGQLTHRLLSNIVKDLLKESIPSEAGEGESLSAESTEHDISKSIINNLFKKICASVGADETKAEDKADGTGFHITDEGGFKVSDEYELVVDESQIELMQRDICKCTEALQRKEFVRKLLKEGKAKVICKSQTHSRSEDLPHPPPFEYESDAHDANSGTSDLLRTLTADDEAETAHSTEPSTPHTFENVNEEVNEVTSEEVVVEEIEVESEFEVQSIHMESENPSTEEPTNQDVILNEDNPPAQVEAEAVAAPQSAAAEDTVAEDQPQTSPTNPP